MVIMFDGVGIQYTVDVNRYVVFMMWYNHQVRCGRQYDTNKMLIL